MVFRRASSLNAKPQEDIRPKKREPEPHLAHVHDESNWLISYADMMTLLCAFFIMLFSLSKLDEPKYDAMKKEIAKSFGGQVPLPPTRDLEKLVTRVIQDAGAGENTVVKSDPNSVIVAFQSTLFFDTLSSEVKPEGRIVLDRVINAISTRQELEKKQYRIVVEGHTDSRPIIGGIYPSNWELSGARASRVVRLFLDLGFAPDHLMAIGYADTRPEFPSRTPAGTWDDEAMSKNRRVVLRIMEPSVESISISASSSH